MKIQIKPISVGLDLEANYVEFRAGGYILGTNEECKVRCLFYKDGNLIHDSKVVTIPAELVEVWTDDTPLIDYVIDELGLVKVEENTDI